MPDKKELEKVIEDKVKPIINDAMQKFLGVTIGELSSDISDKLKRSPLLDFDIDASAPFKKAKKMFKRQFVIRLLQTNYGNISKAAKAAGIDRRSIHRLIKELSISSSKFREELMKPEYVKQSAVSSVIEHTLDNYKQVIRPEKLEEVYKNVSLISKNILKELPVVSMTLKEAEEEFEKLFLEKVVKDAGSITKAAKKIGLRYETLHRKMKKLGL